MKKQMIFQKLIVMIMLICFALCFIFALGLSTTLYDTLWLYADPDEPGYYVPGAEMFYDIQPFNKAFVLMSLIGILVTLSLFFTHVGTRRRYHIGNYVATGLTSGYSVIFTIYSLIMVGKFRSQYLNGVDFALLEEKFSAGKKVFYKSTMEFTLATVALVLTLLVALALVANLIWKLKLMKAEDRLLAGPSSNIDIEGVVA